MGTNRPPGALPRPTAIHRRRRGYIPLVADHRASRNRRRLTATVTDLAVRRQRALLVSLATNGHTTADAEISLQELARLADTAGSDAVDRSVQQRPHPDPATFIGKGKAAELAALGHRLDVDVVVIDGELTPVQQRNLAEIFGCDVVDRVAVILDIFAQHATSREGMAQVELALLRHRLPRLRGRGRELSQQAGGIGTRGPGETQLESDRRRVQRRISVLEGQIKGLRTTRATQRKGRRRSGLATATLVGYTNAGKSSLLNRLTGAGVLVEDRLFSTLDATVRRLALPSGRTALLSDTVGFVRHLPHELVEAFRSTLEEAVETDLLVHVVDAAAPDPEGQIDAVRSTLAQVGGGGRAELLVMNKIDLAPPPVVARLLALHPEAGAVSAATGAGLDAFLTALDERLAPAALDLELLIPHQRSDLVAALHRVAEVFAQSHEEAGVRLEARLPAAEAGPFLAYTV
jgi:GTP-binding protein HflX